jgi:hypothetical protein
MLDARLVFHLLILIVAGPLAGALSWCHSVDMCFCLSM